MNKIHNITIHAPTDDGTVYGNVTLIRDARSRGAHVAITRKELPEFIRQLQIINAGQQHGQTIVIPSDGSLNHEH